MPRPRTRLAGIVLAALLGAGCGGVQAPKLEAPPPAPSYTPSPGPTTAARWTENLSFSGDVNGTMTTVVPLSPQVRSECTGHNSRPAGTWASTIFGLVGSDVYGVLFAVGKYRGPGSYNAPDVTVQVHRSDNSAVWQSSADKATFTIAPDEESGTVEATLTNLANNQATMRVSGTWTCST
jgi:hypothetical protein